MENSICTLRQDALEIFQSAVKSVIPNTAVQHALKSWLKKHQNSLGIGKVVVVAVGKAAWPMAMAAHHVLGDFITTGLVVTKDQHAIGPIPSFEIMESGHPVPDHRSVMAGRRAMELVRGLTAEDYVLMLISGGGSALLECPMEGVALDEIMGITRQLINGGASIREINTIRKRLSAIKGGKFAQLCQPATLYSIILSDVLGDQLDVIASGPCVPDLSTTEEAMHIANTYNLRLSNNALAALEVETPKNLDKQKTFIAGNVRRLCDEAAKSAMKLGYVPMILTTTLDCEAKEAGKMLASIAREISESQEVGNRLRLPCAVIFGGETIVHVTGEGKGGRNQELALSAAMAFEEIQRAVVISAGSDGTDGPTDAAGGLVDGGSVKRMREQGCSPEKSLAENDAYHALATSGDLVVTGPTGTNVNDLMMILCR